MTVTATFDTLYSELCRLAAPGSEAEARTAISRLQQRYCSALGGRQPTVSKATVGDVYRIRVVGLSQADGNGLCEKLKPSAAAVSSFASRRQRHLQ